MSYTNLDALNEKQREAVVSEDKRLLVLAGAGSGKTKTLLQKIIYLIEEKGVSPRDILAITFTKNAAGEMLDRLILTADTSGAYAAILHDKKKSQAEKDTARHEFVRRYKWIEGLTVRTFHSFGYNLLRNYGVHEFDNRFRLIGEEKSSEEDEFARYTAPETAFDVFYKLLIQKCEDREHLLALKRYVLDYLVDKIHLKESGIQQLRQEGKYYTTLDGTRVRSKSEQFIADYLYRNSIAYEYEPTVQIKDFPFRPDFYIPAANLYLEHVSNKSYAMRDKEEQFHKGEILFAKTTERTAENSALFTNTLDNLLRGRLPANAGASKAIGFQEAFKGHLDHLKEFVHTVMRITDMMKVERLNAEQVLTNARQDQHERIRNFYELAIPLAKSYEQYCVDKSYLDFNDLISKTVSLLEHHPDVARKMQDRYPYILVDEFQDVNNLQVELIRLLLTEQTQLFCVGDDWQSIYGFRGSEVSYIIDFERHFPGCSIIKLDLNYRSSQHIVGASNEVIKHNRYKIDKDIRASKVSRHKITVYAGTDEEENVAYCMQRIRECLDAGIPAEELLFLYRRSKMFHPFYEGLKREGLLRIPYKTIHAAKGLEARVVFIVGLTDGFGGFPDIWLADRIFQVLKKANLDLLLEEERRLFYVAITRAKDKLFLITEKGRESSFLKEIPSSYTERAGIPLGSVVQEVRLCPACSRQIEPVFSYCPHCGRAQG
ncbi:MAG: UvrD-helicase domain-containing protein [Lewinellaceae bacterium]|nr:UvrD-helicase domain-containing protein [Lewinellaceae bacterium]